MIKLTRKVVSVYDRKTSVRLTNIEWKILDRICYQEKIKRKYLLEQIQTNHSTKLGFTPAIKLFTLLYTYHKIEQRHKESLLQKSLLRLK